MGHIFDAIFPLVVQFVLGLATLAAVGGLCLPVLVRCVFLDRLLREVPFGLSRLESFAMRMGRNRGLPLPLPVPVRAAPPGFEPIRGPGR